MNHVHTLKNHIRLFLKPSMLPRSTTTVATLDLTYIQAIRPISYIYLTRVETEFQPVGLTVTGVVSIYPWRTTLINNEGNRTFGVVPLNVQRRCCIRPLLWSSQRYKFFERGRYRHNNKSTRKQVSGSEMLELYHLPYHQLKCEML